MISTPLSCTPSLISCYQPRERTFPHSTRSVADLREACERGTLEKLRSFALQDVSPEKFYRIEGHEFGPEDMSRYMSATFCPLIAFLLSASGDGSFINPPRPGEAGDFSGDPVFGAGESQMLSFQLDEDHADGISIALWQEQGIGPDNPYTLASMLNLSFRVPAREPSSLSRRTPSQAGQELT